MLCVSFYWEHTPRTISSLSSPAIGSFAEICTGRVVHNQKIRVEMKQKTTSRFSLG